MPFHLETSLQFGVFQDALTPKIYDVSLTEKKQWCDCHKTIL